MDNVFIVEEWGRNYPPIGKWVVRARFREDEELMAHSVMDAYLNAYHANDIHMRIRFNGPNGPENVIESYWCCGVLRERYRKEEWRIIPDNYRLTRGKS